MATKFNCSGEAAAFKAAEGDDVPEVIVRDSERLGDLNDAQIDHVSLGLERSFSCHLEREGMFVLVHEMGLRQLMPDNITVIDAWNTAKAMDEEDEE